MSTITNIYPVSLYTDNSQVTLASHRLVVLHYKEPTDKAKKLNAGVKKLPSLVLSIPAIKIEVKPAEIAAIMQSAFYDMQDNAIRADIERQVGTYTGQSLSNQLAVNEEVFGLAAITASQTSAKLSKEQIAKWYTENLEGPLMVAISAKKGYNVVDASVTVPEDVQASVVAACNQVRDLLTKMAAPTWNLPNHILDQLSKCVAVAYESNLKTILADKIATKMKPAAEIMLEVL